MNKNKIINDPVYGFITIPGNLVYALLEHPYFQRLRRIKQLGMSEYVYPGAVHSRFHHALGALHLMMQAVQILRQKGIRISDREAEGLYCGILLHDIGHGPYSHSLEHTLIRRVPHEHISLVLMEKLNAEFKGKLDLAIRIFTGKYERGFFHQLISGQLDMDRLDYLGRDSFFTGVTEGVVGSERIINMLNVVDDELVVEEKGIYSVEKFIIARRLMYWQVYLHKTVVASDLLLTNVMKRATELANEGRNLFATPALEFFLDQNVNAQMFRDNPKVLQKFVQLDDTDIFSAIKSWQHAEDKVLSLLSRNLVNRHLPKILISNKPYSDRELREKQDHVSNLFQLKSGESVYFASIGSLRNDAYQVEKGNIRILMKNGELLDVTEASDNYNLKALRQTVKKYYLSFYR